MEPVKDVQTGKKPVIAQSFEKNGPLKNSGSSGTLVDRVLVGRGVHEAGLSGASAAKSLDLCCFFQGVWCTRCCWLIFLLGVLLGALIAGLVTGLVLGRKVETLEGEITIN